MLKALLAIGLLWASPAFSQATINGVPPVTTGWVSQAEVTLDSSGNATWVFDPTNLPPATPFIVHMPKAMDANNPITCNWMNVTVTQASIHCWRTTLTGLLTGLFGGNVTGAKVTLVARVLPSN